MNTNLALTSGKCDRRVKQCKHFTVLCSCAKCGIIRLVCSTICWTVYVTCYISLQYQSKTNFCCFFFTEKLIDQRIWALVLKRFGLILSTGLRKTKGGHFWAFNSFHRFSVGLRSGAWPLHHIEILQSHFLLILALGLRLLSNWKTQPWPTKTTDYSFLCLWENLKK